jgi:hypothetical protein
MKKISNLAHILKNSNIKEVSELAHMHIALVKEYNELADKYVLEVSKRVCEEHSDLLKRLADEDASAAEWPDSHIP